MTQISYISGIGADERKDRAAEIPERSYINYTALTDGELRLTLLADQVNMLAAYYPEDRDLQKAKDLLINALYKGVHNTPVPSGIYTGTLATVVSAIRHAQRNFKPAAGKIIDREQGISGGIGDPIIPYEDCGYNILTGMPTDPECVKMNAIKKILNDNLEKSAHHILYKFVKNPNAATPVVAAKTINHRAVIGTLSTITKVSESTIAMWVRNGVIRNNAARGAGMIEPETTIQVFKENAAGMGAIPIVAIIAAIAAAITAAAQLVAAIKQQDPAQAALWNQFQGIGTGVFGPEGEDWQNFPPPGSTYQNNTNKESETDYLPLLLLGGAGLLLLK